MRFFFGKLKQAESSMIAEKCKVKLFDIGLTMIYMRDDVNVYTASFLVALFSNYIFHWLTIMRVEHLLVNNNLSFREHLKMYVLHFLLLWLDVEVMMYLYRNNVGLVYQLLGFQFCFMGLMIGLSLFKYTISFAEIILLANYRNKTVLFNVVELLADVVKLGLQTYILIYMYKKGILPIPIIYEMVECVLMILQRLGQFLESRELENNLKSFPTVTRDEIPDHNLTCLVCLEEMEEGKKLNCEHVFHHSCLRGWIVLKNYCPKCRELIDRYHGTKVVVQKASEVDQIIHEGVKDLGHILRQEAQRERSTDEVEKADLFFHYQDSVKTMKVEDSAPKKEEVKIEEPEKKPEGDKSSSSSSEETEVLPEVPNFAACLHEVKTGHKSVHQGRNLASGMERMNLFELATPAVEYGLPTTANSEITINVEILRKKFEDMNSKVIKFYEDDIVLFRPQVVSKTKSPHQTEQSKTVSEEEIPTEEVKIEETEEEQKQEEVKLDKEKVVEESKGKEDDPLKRYKDSLGGLWSTMMSVNSSSAPSTSNQENTTATSVSETKLPATDGKTPEEKIKSQREIQYEAILRRTATEALKEEDNNNK